MTWVNINYLINNYHKILRTIYQLFHNKMSTTGVNSIKNNNLCNNKNMVIIIQ